jgi:glucokinase
VQRARTRLADSQTPSRLRELDNSEPESLTAQQVAEAFRAGDALAKEVLEATADLLAIWLGNMIDLLEPDVIVFGGGIATLLSEFFHRIQTELPKWTINSRCCEIPLLLAKYGSDAGIAGAAALCRQQQ